jgi:two-component system, NtrC family, nitrogen regulation sensor histidine kinase NtrY
MSIPSLVEQEKRCYRTGEIIFRQGDDGSTMILILSGSVEILKDGIVIAQRGPGEFIGEMALVEETPRSATVVAQTDCEISECTRDRFLEVIQDDPTFALALLKDLSHKLRESDSQRISELEANNLHLQIKNKELSLVNDFLEQLIDQSPAAIIIANKQGEVRRANSAAAKVFEVGPNESWQKLLSYLPNSNPIQSLWNSLQPSWVGEAKASIGGRAKTLYLSVSRLHSYDPESSYLFICEDISELIELNEQIIKLERFATEGEISSGIAHDIKNYLAILRGNFDLMHYKFDSEFKILHQNQITAMENGFQEIESFVENLMGGRGDEGVLTSANLSDIVRVIVRFLSPQTRFHKIAFHQIVDPSFPTQLQLNERQMQQVLLNLFMNAAEALNSMPDDLQKEITVEMGIDPSSGKPRMSVSDNGPGIPPERQADLFQKRFTTKERGHGIGLITIKKIIEQHQGTIEAESTLGVGTKFTITFAS